MIDIGISAALLQDRKQITLCRTNIWATLTDVSNTLFYCIVGIPIVDWRSGVINIHLISRNAQYFILNVDKYDYEESFTLKWNDILMTYFIASHLLIKQADLAVAQCWLSAQPSRSIGCLLQSVPELCKITRKCLETTHVA